MQYIKSSIGQKTQLDIDKRHSNFVHNNNDDDDDDNKTYE